MACAGAPTNPGKSGAIANDGGVSSSDPRIERIVVDADAIAIVAPGESHHDGAMPNIFVLGRSDKNERLFLRFPIRLPKIGVLKSAMLLLSRTRDVDMAPAPIALHAARVVDAWDARSVSWAFQPRVEEARAPLTTVTLSGADTVRLDVRSIVQDFPLRDPKDQGIAVLADVTSSTGASFAYVSSGARPPQLEVFWAYPDDIAGVDAGAADASVDSGTPRDSTSLKKH